MKALLGGMQTSMLIFDYGNKLLCVRAHLKSCSSHMFYTILKRKLYWQPSKIIQKGLFKFFLFWYLWGYLIEKIRLIAGVIMKGNQTENGDEEY